MVLDLKQHEIKLWSRRKNKNHLPIKIQDKFLKLLKVLHLHIWPKVLIESEMLFRFQFVHLSFYNILISYFCWCWFSAAPLWLSRTIYKDGGCCNNKIRLLEVWLPSDPGQTVYFLGVCFSLAWHHRGGVYHAGRYDELECLNDHRSFCCWISSKPQWSKTSDAVCPDAVNFTILVFLAGWTKLNLQILFDQLCLL